MTVAMMGISYQVMNLIVVGNSVQGIASMTVVLFMLQQAMENVSMMAISITSGGGLGTSNGAAFLGLSQALGMMVGGLATFGGAELDKLTSKQGENEIVSGKAKNSEKEERDYIRRKARENVGRPILNEEKPSGKQLGVVYSKGHLKPNMRRVEDSFERLDKKRKEGLGVGAKAGLVTATFIQGMTGSLDDILTLKKVIKRAGEVIGNGKNTQNNIPYNVLSQTEQQKKEAIDMLKNGW